MLFLGTALRAGDRPAWMGSAERMFYKRSERGKGETSFPPEKRASVLRRSRKIYVEFNLYRSMYDTEIYLWIPLKAFWIAA
jgi:hypothetical protein